MRRDGRIELANQIESSGLAIPDRRIDADSGDALPATWRPGQRNGRLARAAEKRRHRKSLTAAIVVRHKWRNDHSPEASSKRVRLRSEVAIILVEESGG